MLGSDNSFEDLVSRDDGSKSGADSTVRPGPPVNGRSPAGMPGSLARGGLWSAAAHVVPQAYSLIISIAAVRALGPDGMGRQSFIAFVELSLILLFTGGLPLALMRYVGEYLGRGRPAAVRGLVTWAWRIETVAAAAAGGALVGAALLGAQPRAAWLMAAVAAAACIMHSVPSALLIGAQRWRDAKIAGLTAGALATAASVALLAAGGGITGMFVIEASAAVVGLVWTRRLAGRALADVTPDPAAAHALRIEVLRYAGPAFGGVLVSLIVWRRSELFFLARWAGDADIAIYSVAFALTAALGMIFEAFAAVVTPAVATLVGIGERRTIQIGYRRAARLVLVATLPVTAIAIAVGPALLRLLYGDALPGAGPILLIMLATFPIVPLTTMSSAFLHGLGRQRMLLVAGVAAAAVDIALATLLIPRFAAVGAAIANGAAQLTVGIPLLTFVSRTVGGLGLETGQLASLAASSIGAAIAGLLSVSIIDGPAAVPVGLAAALIAFIALAAAMRILAAEDADWLEAAIGPRFGSAAQWFSRGRPAATAAASREPAQTAAAHPHSRPRLAVALRMRVHAALSAQGRTCTFVLLLSLVGAFPWDDALPYPSQMISVIKLLGLALIVSYTVQMMVRTERPRCPATLLPVVGFIAVVGVSLALSGDATSGIVATLRYVLYASFFFLVVQIVTSRARMLRVLEVLTLSSTVAAAVGLAAFLSSAADRASGPIGEANDFAYVLATVLPVAVYLARRGDRIRIGWAACVVVLSATILATLSRGALVGLTAAGAFSFRRGWLRPRSMLVAAGILCAIVAVAMLFWRPLIAERITAKLAIAGQNVASREALWRGALRMAADHPVLGVGTGLFGVRAGEYVIDEPFGIIEPVAHNTYLEILAEGGVLALLAFGGFLVGTWALFTRALRLAAAGGDVEAEALAAALQLSFVVATVSACFLSMQFAPPLWLLGGLAVPLAATARTRA